MKLVEIEKECQAKDNTIDDLSAKVQEKSNEISNMQENNENILSDLGSLYTNYIESEKKVENLNTKFLEQEILVKCQQTEIYKLKAELNSLAKVDIFSSPENAKHESSPNILKEKIAKLKIELKLKSSLLVESTTVRESLEDEFSQRVTDIEEEKAREIMEIKTTYQAKLEEDIRKIKSENGIGYHPDSKHKCNGGKEALESCLSDKDVEHTDDVNRLMQTVNKWAFQVAFEDYVEKSIGLVEARNQMTLDGRVDYREENAEEKFNDSLMSLSDNDNKKDRNKSGDSGIQTDDDTGKDDKHSADIKIPTDNYGINIQPAIDIPSLVDIKQVDNECI